MPRLTVVLVAFALLGCAPDAEPSAQPSSPVSATSVTLPTGGPVDPVDGERQRLSVAQLLAYFPETAGPFERQRLDSSTEQSHTTKDGAVIGTASLVTVRYTLSDPDARASGFYTTTTVEDFIDAPGRLATAREQFAGRTYYGMFGDVTIEDEAVAGLPAQAILGGSSGPRLRMLIADRFVVDVWQGNGPRTFIDTDDLVAFVEASPLPRLAEAPAFADAGDAPVPAWAAETVAANEAAEREREAEQAARDAETVAVSPLPCDEILSASDVAGVLGAPVEVRPTPVLDEQPQACNRTYKPQGISGGVILIISRYTNASTAEGALRVASDHEGKVDVQPLAGGLNGISYTHDLSSDTHVAHFALGLDFVELKATAAGEPVPEITPAQLAEVATIVAGRLAE